MAAPAVARQEPARTSLRLKIDELARMMASTQIEAEAERTKRYEAEAKLDDANRELTLVLRDNRELTQRLDSAYVEIDRLHGSGGVGSNLALSIPR